MSVTHGSAILRVMHGEAGLSEVVASFLEGGPGSGHFGHRGRIGVRGGSTPGGTGKSYVRLPTTGSAQMRLGLAGRQLPQPAGSAITVGRGKRSAAPAVRTKPQIRAWRKRRENMAAKAAAVPGRSGRTLHAAAMVKAAALKAGEAAAVRAAVWNRREGREAAIAKAAADFRARHGVVALTPPRPGNAHLGVAPARQPDREARTPAAVRAWRTRRANAERAAAGGLPVRAGGKLAVVDTAMRERWAREESALAKTPIKDIQHLGGGIGQAKIITYKDGSQGVYKTGLDWKVRARVPVGGEPVREAAAWEVAKIVGMHDLVPPTILKSPDGKLPVGSIMRFVPDAVRAGDARAHDLKKFDGAKDAKRAAAFDYVTGQADRHGNNWLVEKANNHLVLIDHGYGFPTSNQPQRGNFQLQEHAAKSKIPPEIKAAWFGKWPQLETALKKVGIESEAISAMRSRYDALIDPNAITFRDAMRRTRAAF